LLAKLPTLLSCQHLACQTLQVCSIAPSPDAVEVVVDAKPVDGEANAAIVEYIADTLGLKRRDVAVATGATSRHKVLAINGLCANDVLHRLQQACS
jgi:hypothetical protein